MLPRLGTSPLVTRWIVVTLAASILGVIDGRLAAWAAFIPSRIVQGEVWRLVTWPFFEMGPVSLIFTCVAIFKFGGELAERWGDRRLLRFMLETVGSAAVITCLLALVTGDHRMVRLGGWAATEVLVIAWARQFPTRPLVLYGLLVLRGQTLINVVLGSAIVFAIYIGPVRAGLELLACAAAAFYPTQRLRSAS